MEAPELFASDNEGHCFVRRQPQSAEELTRRLEAIRLAELDCIRYSGTNRSILRILIEDGEIERADYPQLMSRFRLWMRRFF
jgi:hypothetical protein